MTPLVAGLLGLLFGLFLGVAFLYVQRGSHARRERELELELADLRATGRNESEKLAWLDGAVHLRSKAKAQKIVNLRRDPRCSIHVESGARYEELAGVNLAGRAELLDDEATLWRIGIALDERRHGPWDEARRPIVEQILRNRVGVRLRPERVVSWDHAKLPAGSYPAG